MTKAEHGYELSKIIENEQRHFTYERAAKYLSTLTFLILTQMVLGTGYEDDNIVPDSLAYICIGAFVLYSIWMSYNSA